jgi:hypothetical protein
MAHRAGGRCGPPSARSDPLPAGAVDSAADMSQFPAPVRNTLESSRRRPADALTLANELDAAWHAQTRCFEREAVARFWGLLTLPARILDAERARALLGSATVLRNAQFRGDRVKGMFFADKDFTEVDALFLRVGSCLGHLDGDDAWVVEVERKAAHQQGDYYLAIQRARRFAELFAEQFRVHARAVVIYEDDGGRLTYQDFDGEVLLISMTSLRERTRGLTFPCLRDLPGVACDKTLVKLALIRQLVTRDPYDPGWYAGPLALARELAADGIPLHLPVVGQQDTGRIPESVDRWLSAERESDAHLVERIDRYLAELRDAGVLERTTPSPRLSEAGGHVVLRLLQSETQDAT